MKIWQNISLPKNSNLIYWNSEGDVSPFTAHYPHIYFTLVAVNVQYLLLLWII